MTESIEDARRCYAEELRSLSHISSPALLAAFAMVPRERFVGPGPWRIKGMGRYWATEDTDPRRVYHNVLIELDGGKGINNGQPSLWAFCFDQLGFGAGDHVLHLGCGTGYYTAILAELTGPEGRVTALEIDEALAERARVALEPWPQAAVVHGDGSSGPFEPADVIVVSAGVTHPLPAWLNAVKPGGKLLFPLTVTRGPGIMMLLTRKSADGFAARLLCGVAFIDFSGARDPEVSIQLGKALRRDQGAPVKSLRCDSHEKEESCWLHGDGWCFSTRAPLQAEPAAKAQ
jgi:protein-L-isoaspartate(D-aspartate) O-methyltransferase